MNEMVINYKKTKSMLVLGKQQRKLTNNDQNGDGDSLTITLNDSQIESVRSHNFLGDDDLNFENHCEDIVKKTVKKNWSSKIYKSILEEKPKRNIGTLLLATF